MAKDLKTLTLAGTTAWRMLRKDLTTYVRQTPDLAKIENLSRLDEMMVKGAGILLCLLCSAKQPICRRESETINALIGENHNEQYYNLWLRELANSGNSRKFRGHYTELTLEIRPPVQRDTADCLSTPPPAMLEWAQTCERSVGFVDRILEVFEMIDAGREGGLFFCPNNYIAEAKI